LSRGVVWSSREETSIKMVDAATLDKLEAGFKKLEAATNCKSLLKKYLTRDVFDQLKNKKTALGATLLDVIQSGVENLDSGVGLYAPDAESYSLFAPLFDPVIEDYHVGFKQTDSHPPKNFGDVNAFVNVDPEGKYVVSTRIRCGRSLQGYPFNPCLTESQYKEMEEKVSSTLAGLEGELKGTFYPLTGMQKDVQQKLIDDHFLFKEGDRFLQAANACRYWPAGRGIYHNDDKTFLVWCNEEDHLRIISMQMGGDIGQVFRRLVSAANEIEKRLPFSHHDRLGFQTFCPTNLGTTIRASVHIGLPKLAADLKKLEAIAGKYNLQVRGTRGEHTEAEGGIYDISNKRRMGLTEFDAVMEMQKGIIELIKMEKEMEKGGSGGGKVVDPAVLQQLESNFKNLEAATHYFLAAVKTCQSTLSMFSPGQKMDDPEIMKKLEAGFTKLANAKNCKSLLKKYLTREVFDKLKDKKTKLGATLLDVIQSGVENLDSGVGLYAPDAEAYSLFAPLFDPVIEDYHVGFKQTDFHPQKNFGDVNAFINVDPEGKYVVSTRIRCGRSLQGYPFNPCLTKAMYEEMEKKVSTALAGLGGELKGTFYPLTGMSKAVQQKLIDDHFLFKEGDRFLQAANACRYWPAGRGIYHNDDKTFLVWCNEEDHLRIISMQMGGDIGQVFRRLVNGANSIEKIVPFSHHDRLGFQTFCPTNLGTTIRASVHIGLPKLAADLKKLEAIAGKYNLQVRGTRGEHTEAEGGIYDISNKRRMGLTEFDAVMEMQNGILELIKMEKAM